MKFNWSTISWLTTLIAMLATVPIAMLATVPVVAQAAVSADDSAVSANDSGTFRISIEGKHVGTEDFFISQIGTGPTTVTTASGRVDRILRDEDFGLTPHIRASGVEAAPTSYTVDISGDSPRRITAAIGGGRVSAKIITADGEQLREYVASQRAVILENGVAHHYSLMARRLHEGRVPVIVPRENRQIIATVVDKGEDRIEIDGQEIQLTHLVVRPPGEDDRHIWVDASNRVLKVKIPQKDYVAERTEIPK